MTAGQTEFKTPKSVHMIKAVSKVFKFVKNPIPILSEYVEEYGDTFVLHFGGGRQRSLLTTEPEVIRHVLQKNNRNYAKSKLQKEKLGQYLGQGLLTSDGDYWLQQRRLIQPGFHRDKLNGLVTLMNGVIDDVIAKFDRYAETGATFDMYEEMLETAFGIIAKSIFSTGGESDLELISENITTIQEFLVKQVRQPYLEWWFQLSGQTKKHVRKSVVLSEIVLKYIQDRRKTRDRHDDLLDMLIAARYEGTDKGMTDKQLLDESIILFVAGHDTSANALAWGWYLLTQNLHVLNKLREEVSMLDGRDPEFTDLPKLTYTRQVIDETMRIYPPAWITDRVALKDDNAFGYKISAGSLVVPYIYGVHHNEKYWPEPKKFMPERFSKENKKQHKPFSYLPFGGGPRLCIGNNFAIMEMQLVLARMAARYDFEVLPDQIIEGLPLVTLRPKYGIKMKVKRRAS